MSAANILPVRDGLQMVRIDAVPLTAKVVDFETFRNRPLIPLVIDAICGAVVVGAVSLLRDVPLPYPARRRIPSILDGVVFKRDRDRRHGVTANEAGVMPGVFAAADLITGEDRRFSSATALAEAGRIRVGWGLEVIANVVEGEESDVLALHGSVALRGRARNRCGRSATALAEAGRIRVALHETLRFVLTRARAVVPRSDRGWRFRERCSTLIASDAGHALDLLMATNQYVRRV